MATEICKTCKGNTTVRQLCPLDACINGMIYGKRKCKRCDGEGDIVVPCTACDGKGVVPVGADFAKTQPVRYVRKP